MLANKINDFYSLILNKGIHFLTSLLGALLVVVIFEWTASHPKEMATVDITAITSNFTSEIKLQKLSEEELKNKITAFGINLEKEIKKLSEDNHLILMPKEAVIAGTPDYTEYLSAKLKNRIQ